MKTSIGRSHIFYKVAVVQVGMPDSAGFSQTALDLDSQDPCTAHGVALAFLETPANDAAEKTRDVAGMACRSSCIDDSPIDMVARLFKHVVGCWSQHTLAFRVSSTFRVERHAMDLAVM